MGKYIAPIIIIGMHRSGTTMIANILQQLGLFIGNDLENNSESMFFVRQNDWLLSQSAASWDDPTSIKWFFNNSDLVEMAKEYMCDHINGMSSIHYMGLKQFLLGCCLSSGMNKPWGWKDPRTTFTLPFWLHLFPDAKVVYIYRNGVSVAASLRTRDRRHLEHSRAMHRKRLALGLYKVIRKKGGFVWSERCLTLEGAFSLWEEYVEAAFKIRDTLTPNFLTLKYEDFLENPKVHINELMKFSGLKPYPRIVTNIITNLKPERAKAYMEDKELTQFYKTVSNHSMMQSLGY